jgi:sugar transferase EpsL
VRDFLSRLSEVAVYLTLKRTIDLLGAASGLLLSAPVMAVAALAIRLSMGSPVFFCQQRPGLHGKAFTLIKLRTMAEARSSAGELYPEELRLNRLGRFLRRTSLDELPELWNVLRGDLSLVGPRPLLMQYLDRYSPEQKRRHDVKPGITGWAQVNGRNAISWEQKFALDCWYVDNCSIVLDLKILALTIAKVVTGEGVSQDGHATTQEFMGSPVSANIESHKHGDTP